jgi:hypothetical protein
MDPETGYADPKMSLRMVDFPEDEAPSDIKTSDSNVSESFSIANSRRGTLEVNFL